MNTTERRVALVTGANRGLGFETSRQLLAKGLIVVLADRDAAALQHAHRSLELNDRRRAIRVQMDVTSVDSIMAAHWTVTKKIGRVDILVNSAPVLPLEEDLRSSRCDVFGRSFETNVFGVVEVCRVFVPEMARAGYGRVVNVSSGTGQLGATPTDTSAYSMSKAALISFTQILAQTHRGSGVLVNAVDPGPARTEIGGPLAPRSMEVGAETIVWLATLPRRGPTGRFFRDRRPIELHA